MMSSLTSLLNSEENRHVNFARLEVYKQQFPYSTKAKELGSLKPISKDECLFVLRTSQLAKDIFRNVQTLQAVDLAMKQCEQVMSRSNLCMLTCFYAFLRSVQA